MKKKRRRRRRREEETVLLSLVLLRGALLLHDAASRYVRDFEVETIGMKETSRRCSDLKCGAKLKDTVLDWEDALPPKEMDPAEMHCKMADLVLCLGTSLQITPACNLPLKSLRGGGKLVIVNLQQTPKDKKASLVIHGKVDKVIAGVMDFLNLQIPPYVRIDLVQLSLSQFPKRNKSVKWTLRIASVHGQRAPLPFLKTVEVSFPDRPDLKAAVLHKQPFVLKRETVKTRPFKMVLDLNFGDGCACPCARIRWPIDFQVLTDDFDHDRGVVFQKLSDAAVQDSCCGQYAAVEKKTSQSPRTEAFVYAIVTNIVRHNSLATTTKAFPPVPKGSRNGVRKLKSENGSSESPKRPKWSLTL